MFSGIVEGKGTVVGSERGSGTAQRLTLSAPFPTDGIRLGDSICVEGVCLTVVATTSDDHLGFDLAEETLRRSTLKELSVGDPVNMERSLALSDRVHGHFVFGHVDGEGVVVSRESDGATERLSISAPASLMHLIAPKGSITVSGVSLTVGEVDADRFSVYLVPHTAEITTIALKNAGDRVNLEVDMLARYVERILSERFRDVGGLG